MTKEGVVCPVIISTLFLTICEMSMSWVGVVWHLALLLSVQDVDRLPRGEAVCPAWGVSWPCTFWERSSIMANILSILCTMSWREVGRDLSSVASSLVAPQSCRSDSGAWACLAALLACFLVGAESAVSFFFLDLPLGLGSSPKRVAPGHVTLVIKDQWLPLPVEWPPI